MKQDIKKDTLKNQLDDALRQGYDASLMINPELAVIQLNTIMDEQILLFKGWYDASSWCPSLSRDFNYNSETLEKFNDKQLLNRFKQENGL